jgi:hypothetical protein
LSFGLESTLKKELVIINVRAICWIVPKKYLFLLDQTIYNIAIFSDELENVKQLNFSLQKFESDNIEFEKSVLIYIIIYRKKYVLRGLCSGKSWYENLLDDGLKSTLTLCPSVLSNFKYWGTRP